METVSSNGRPWLVPSGSVSPFNPSPPGKRVEFYDTTLRDGEQQAGVIFNVAEKVEIFRRLESAGVQYVETGMIATSEEETAVVKRLAAEGHTARVHVLSRAMKSDIDIAADAGADGVTMEILANPTLASAIFGWTAADITTRALAGARAARDRGVDVNFFLIDATRIAVEWAKEMIGALHEQQLVDSVTLADTFGVAEPSGIGALVGEIVREFGVPVHVHAHNDYGLGVANSLAALDAGAQVVQATMNSLGERAGNADLCMVGAAVQFMRQWDSGLDFPTLRGAAELIARYSHIPIPPNAPVIGPALFDVEAGIAAAFYAGARREDLRFFYPYLPELVGSGARIVMGKGSGKANVDLTLERLEVHGLSDEEKRDVLALTKKLGAEHGRLLTDEEFLEICRASDGRGGTAE